VITGAHRLPNRHVIHCLGPVYGHDPAPAAVLAACYRNTLRLAEAHGSRSIAFPAISTGAFFYPIQRAAKIALTTVADVAPGLRCVRHIRFVLRGSDAWLAHVRVLDGLSAGVPD
jgi:O-acetyl-ADP-ribose deacetylase (regulator of RNase III)